VTRLERPEADKLATMRNWSKMSELLKGCKQNVRRTAHCLGGKFTFENVMRLQSTKQLCSCNLCLRVRNSLHLISPHVTLCSDLQGLPNVTKTETDYGRYTTCCMWFTYI